VCTLEAIIKSSENFPGVFEVNQWGKDLGIYELHGEAKKNILKNQNSEAVGAITNETFSLGVVHKWRHTLTGERGSPDLWQIVTRGRGSQ